MAKRKGDGLAGWQKWLLMTVIVGALAAIVTYFNFRVFGWEDGLPYVAVVGFLVLISFIVTLHIKRREGKDGKPVTTNFLKAAFTFEVLCCVVLGINALFSLSVMREMSVAGMAEQQRSSELDTISKLRGSRNQRLALTRVQSAAVKTRQEVFAENERVLFWILAAEITVGIVAVFVLLALSVFDKNNNGTPDFLEEEDEAEEWPEEIDEEQEAGK